MAVNKDNDKQQAKETAPEAIGKDQTQPKPIPTSTPEQKAAAPSQKIEPLNQNSPKKTLLDIIPSGPAAPVAPSDDIRIPKFNLDKHTLAKHRKPVAEKRTAPTQKPEPPDQTGAAEITTPKPAKVVIEPLKKSPVQQPQRQPHEIQILRPNLAEPQADNVIAQIVARDIRKLCQS
jgi:hypothetical protein